MGNSNGEDAAAQFPEHAQGCGVIALFNRVGELVTSMDPLRSSVLAAQLLSSNSPRRMRLCSSRTMWTASGSVSAPTRTSST